MINVIEEIYVNFNVASLLSENGFDVITEKSYNSIGLLLDIPTQNSSHIFISCPTQSVVIDWIEENFGIYVESYVDDDKTFGYIVSKFTDEGRINYPLSRGYNTRSEAINQAIFYTLTKISID